MKVVLSGATGYIGGEVLAQCLEHPSITSILVLTRRDAGIPQDPKIKVILVKDFLAYDEALIDELKTVDAAIWCLGTFNGDETIDIQYPLTFINAIKSQPSRSTPFRYIQLGGAFTEPPPKEGEKERPLWFYASGRRVRGAVEPAVLGTADDSPQSRFSVYLVKPAAVLSKNTALVRCVVGNSLAVDSRELRATMVDLAVNGNEQKVFLNQDIIKHGQRLLEKST